MRLSKLTLWGLKSFADRTEIAFATRPVVGIVGPNGCGKSNVVDAIKWVLGEQSAKSLRGGAMMDVIFNGSSTRKPSGMASVTLTFDNPPEPDGKRRLPIDGDTVAVTRQLYRDGSSEYLINKQRARLRDIRELFMDTGIGTDAYSIIEQGKVDVMLQSNAQERREIFEEAAGISRFKARKKEALRKLEKTEQNLGLSRQRLEDAERRLRSVKVQAGRARSYQEYTGRLRELQLTHALAEFHRFQAQLADVVQKLEQAEADHAAAARDLAKHEQALADAELEPPGDSRPAKGLGPPETGPGVDPGPGHSAPPVRTRDAGRPAAPDRPRRQAARGTGRALRQGRGRVERAIPTGVAPDRGPAGDVHAHRGGPGRIPPAPAPT